MGGANVETLLRILIGEKSESCIRYIFNNKVAPQDNFVKKFALKNQAIEGPRMFPFG